MKYGQNLFSHFNGKSRSKSKAMTEEQCQPFSPGQQTYYNCSPQPNPMCAHTAAPAQDPYQHNQPLYQHQPPIHAIPCLHQCQSQQLIQPAPYQLHQQQPRNGTVGATTSAFESLRLVEHHQQGIVVSNGHQQHQQHHQHHQITQHQPHHTAPPPIQQTVAIQHPSFINHLPTYQGSQLVQSPTSAPIIHSTIQHQQHPQNQPQDSERFNFVDRSYNINQVAAITSQQQHEAQQGQGQQHQQKAQIFNGDHRHTILQNQQQHNDQLRHHQSQAQQTDNSLRSNQLSRQQHHQQHQQQYQNHQTINEPVTNGHSDDDDLPLESRCIMHETNNKELVEFATNLKSDLNKLAEELNRIKRDTPQSSKSKLKI